MNRFMIVLLNAFVLISLNNSMCQDSSNLLLKASEDKKNGEDPKSYTLEGKKKKSIYKRIVIKDSLEQIKLSYDNSGRLKKMKIINTRGVESDGILKYKSRYKYFFDSILVTFKWSDKKQKKYSLKEENMTDEFKFFLNINFMNNTSQMEINLPEKL